MEPQRTASPDAYEIRRCVACANESVSDAIAVWRLHEQADAAKAVHIAREAVKSGSASADVAAFAEITGAEKVAQIDAIASRIAGADTSSYEPLAVAAAHGRRYLGGRVRATPLVAVEVLLGDIAEDTEAAPDTVLRVFDEFWDAVDTEDEAVVPAVAEAVRALLRSRCPSGACEF